MLNFIKKYWLLILIILTVLLLIINKILDLKSPPEIAPSPTPNAASYKSLYPGKSTEDDVSKLLGLPLNITTEDEKEIAKYQSSNKYRNNIVIYENGKVAIIKQVINNSDNLNSDYVTGKYGTAPYILYPQYPEDAFNLYVYPQNGIAYLGHTDKTILEIWYFEPTSIDDFVSRWAKGYSRRKSNTPPQGY